MILMPKHLMKKHVDRRVGENSILQIFDRFMETEVFGTNLILKSDMKIIRKLLGFF